MSDGVSLASREEGDMPDEEVVASILPVAAHVINYLREDIGLTVEQTMGVVAVAAMISRFAARDGGHTAVDDLEARLAPHVQAYVEREGRDNTGGLN